MAFLKDETGKIQGKYHPDTVYPITEDIKKVKEAYLRNKAGGKLYPIKYKRIAGKDEPSIKYLIFPSLNKEIYENINNLYH